VKLCHVMSGYDRLDQVKSGCTGYVILVQLNSGLSWIFLVSTGYVRLYQVSPSYFCLVHVKPG